ncbi:hypothetical protein F5148DRAFT_392693 [Russula earlei]|uniref:Uncharacterized protein n=1 Tax=Russula earlei TaxID=71964 RepID=A0ACC0U027_9AGAM|nr:hypothetical protein F5148DRAFT_392693 [Russula earlei]
MFVSAATPQIIYPSSRAIMVAGNIRVAAVAIAAYDYLITLPAEYRLYKSSSRRSMLPLILFVLIRYFSIVAIAISTTNFFDHNFSPETCVRYSYVGPIIKVIQIMISQAILGIRAYQIAMGRTWVGGVLLSTYIIITVVQWFTVLYNRIAVMVDGDCLTANSDPRNIISAWTFYLAAMLFDCLALSISIFYLLKWRADALPKSTASRLVKLMLYDRLGYLVALTAANMMNIFLFRAGNLTTEKTGACLGIAMTWIMSQRILLHPLEARYQQSTVIQLPTTTTLRFGENPNFDSKTDKSLTVDSDSQDNSHNLPRGRDIEVCIANPTITDAKPLAGEPSSRAT